MDKNSLIHELIKQNQDIQLELGDRLHEKIIEVVIPEWQEAFKGLTKQDCYDYIHNLTINRTYDGYNTEIQTIYGQLEGAIEHKIDPAPDKLDRAYSVDFVIKIEDKQIGLQIKPIASGQSLNDYQWVEMHKVNHQKFEREFGGKVFFVYSTKSTAGKKKIHNVEVIEDIRNEINRLKNL